MKTCKDRVLEFLKRYPKRRFSIVQIRMGVNLYRQTKYRYSTIRDACITLKARRLIEGNQWKNKRRRFWARKPLHLKLGFIIGRSAFFLEDPTISGVGTTKIEGKSMTAYVDCSEFAEIVIGFYWRKRYGG